MKNIFQLLGQLKNYKGKISLYFLCSIAALVFSLFSFTMLAPVLQLLFVGKQALGSVNSGLIAYITNWVNFLMEEQGKIQALTYVIAFVILFTILKNLFIYLSFLLLNPIRNGVIKNIREDIFVKVLSLPLGFFTEEKKGDIMSRMTNDVNEVEVSILSVLQTIIREPVTILGTLAYMVYISPALTLFLLLFLPIVGFIIGKVGSTLKRPSNLAQRKLGQIMEVIEESLSGMRILKAFNAEKAQHGHFQKINNSLFNLQNKILARRDLGSPLSETLGIIVVGVILWYGGWLIFSDNNSSGLTGPWFIVYVGLFYQIINPIKNLSTAFYNMQKGSAALDRIQEIFKTENKIIESEHPQSIKTFVSKIEFKNVSFSYNATKVLDQISLEVPHGTSLAIVGASGSGKSTLVDLIARFHDVTEGSILIDGHDIRDLNLIDLRNLIGMVSQDPILFNDTIENNINLGRKDVVEDQIIEAAKIASAHTFISNQPQGYQTVIGNRGMKLSGGERQRITIARAVLKNPPILILDEATSSLDTESEKLVQNAIDNLMKNRTSIIIAHRLSTIKNADRIIVLDKGRIVESGSHQDLIKQDGVYKKLVYLQNIK